MDRALVKELRDMLATKEPPTGLFWEGIKARYPHVPDRDVNHEINVLLRTPRWQHRYMTAEEYANVPPPRFLIDRFLVKDSITMIAGRVSQRKSIVSMNLCHALCTGEPLFVYFNVVAKP